MLIVHSCKATYPILQYYCIIDIGTGDTDDVHACPAKRATSSVPVIHIISTSVFRSKRDTYIGKGVTRMAFQPCPETAEVRLQGILLGQQVENVFHVRISTTPTLANLTDIANAVNDWATGTYANHMSNGLSWTQIVVTDLNTAGGIQYIKDMSSEGGGTITDPVKTNQDTFAVSFKTGLSGRSYRGRVYVLAVPSGYYNTPNTLNPLNQAAYVTVFNTLREDLDTAGFPLGVLSRYNKDAVPTPPHKRAEGLLTDVVTVTSTDNIIDSQNRRLPGRGR